MPPYHPDCNEGDAYHPLDDEDSLVSSDDEIEDNIPLGELSTGNVKVRRGSEGYEVRPVSREEMLRQYMESVGEDYDRYLQYVPQPEPESENMPVDGSAGPEGV